MTIFSGDTFTDQMRVFFNPIRSDPGFVSPIRSGPGFVNPIRSDPIRSRFVNGHNKMKSATFSGSMLILND